MVELRDIGGTPNSGVRVHFNIQVIVPRATEISSALALLEELMVDVGEAAATIGMLWDGGTSDLQPGKVNDIDALMVSMPYAITI